MPSCQTVELRNAHTSAVPAWLFAVVAAAAFAFLFSVYVGVSTPEYGITRLFTAGSIFNERGIAAYWATPKYVDPYPPHRWGFDGQLYAELSLDPLLRDPGLERALDNPPYRSRRILLSWLAAVGGLGQPFWTLNVYAALNLVFWIGYAWLAAKLFRPLGWAGLAGYGAVLVTCGVIECVRGSLTDFPSFVLMLWATMIGGTGGAVVLAAALLGRESCVLGFVGIVEFGPPWIKNFKKNLGRGLIVIGPLLLWVGYVLWRFRHQGNSSDGGNLERPLAGIMGKLGELTVTAVHGKIHWRNLFSEMLMSYQLHGLLTIIALVSQCVYLALHREWGNRLWRFAAIYVPYFLCIGALSWESHFTVTRHALPITLGFNLLLATRPRRGWLVWFLLGNCFVPFGVHYFAKMPGDRTPPPPAECEIVVPPAGANSPAAKRAFQAIYAKGWSSQQWKDTETWRWGTGPKTELLLRNKSAEPALARFRFITRSVVPRELSVTQNGDAIWHGKITSRRRIVMLPLWLPPGETRLVFASAELPAGADDDSTTGEVTFMMWNARLEVTSLFAP